MKQIGDIDGMGYSIDWQAPTTGSKSTTAQWRGLQCKCTNGSEVTGSVEMGQVGGWVQ